MSELQSTIEFSVELYKFYNVDLFQRGMYQVRCCLRVQSKFTVEVEVTTPEVTTGLGSAIVLGNYGACRPFQILYRNEEVTLKDVVLFRCHMLVDGHHLRESLEKADFSLVLELWFSDNSPVSMVMVSTRTLSINLSPLDGLHYHLPVLFDYFHLSAISVTIHAALTALHQPSLKRGLLRYVQSCAPKTSKTWSKNRSTQCTSLTDPVLPPQSAYKVYGRLNDFPQIQKEAYNVLIESSNNIKSIIKEYRILLLQREEVIGENYESLIIKQNKYNLKNNPKKQIPIKQNSSLAELCAENIKLWNYFLLNFSCKSAIQQKLSKKHHNLRVKRFSELFFVIYNPRKSAIGCYDTNYNNYLFVSELARRSKYMQFLPSLPVHCGILDGDPNSMPIIYEDQYQDFTTPINNKCDYQMPTPKSDTVPKNRKPEDTNCSCGISNLLEMQKYATVQKVPNDAFHTARHSKSLDQLQKCSKATLHHSLGNIKKIPSTSETNGKFCFYKIEPRPNNNVLKNVRSEHDMARNNYIIMDQYLANSTSKRTLLDCSLYSPPKNTEVALKNGTEAIKIVDIPLTDNFVRTYPKRIKTRNQKKLVKSLSSTPKLENQTMVRSNSMQNLSPKKLNKFNSLYFKRPKFESESDKSSTFTNNGYSHTLPRVKQKKLKSQLELSRSNFHISSSSSTESVTLNRKPSKKRKRYPSIRRVKSMTNLDDERLLLPLTGAESLPSIIPKVVQKLKYTTTKYYTSTSSTDSEESGWITSKSSSSSFGPAKNENEKNSTKNGRYLDVDRKNGTRKKTDKKTNGFEDTVNLKEGQMDDVALPPPKQFRDLNSSSSSFTNETNNEEEEPESEELNGVDNLLYHVIDTHTNLDMGSKLFMKNTYEPDETGFYKGSNMDFQKVFTKAKNEFKSQLNFPGLLYSDVFLHTSSVPYFHISDEFRIFSPEGMHLIVCVHGLDGNSADLRLVKTYLELGLPGAYLDFLMSERNQGDTFSDFDIMTDRLVSEILHYLDTSSIRPTRISFVGHSLGTIIIRSALTRPQMKFLLPRLHTFLSLSGPHLGTLYNSSGLVNMGMWVMQKWKKSGSLLQLCLKDANDPRQSFLYRLSQRSTIHHFKNVLLCGSGQDRYVPLHSARIELCKEALKDTSEQGAIFREMVHNIISPIVAQKDIKLVRYDVHHALPNTANTLIGRAAHIAVLDSELFIEKFMAVVGIKYFR